MALPLILLPPTHTPPSSLPCCAWLLLFDLCPRLQVGGADVQSWPITIRASPTATRPLWGWITSRLPTADSPVSGNLSDMNQWELRTVMKGVHETAIIGLLTLENLRSIRKRKPNFDSIEIRNLLSFLYPFFLYTLLLLPFSWGPSVFKCTSETPPSSVFRGSCSVSASSELLCKLAAPPLLTPPNLIPSAVTPHLSSLLHQTRWVIQIGAKGSWLEALFTSYILLLILHL